MIFKGLLILAAYMLGSIPTGYWLGKLWKGVDVRQQGSGNLGATNVFRVLGWGPGAFTLAFDIFKGFMPVYYCQHIFAGQIGMAVAVGLATIIGHTTSFWVHFKGGKGVATSAGVFLALLPLPGVIALGIFLLSLAVTRIVSISSMLAAVGLALSAWVLSTGPFLAGAATIVAALIVYKHRGNISRLVNGTEPRIYGQ
jgi:glycerol-3-phosphate acyltransferase PlsY